MSRRNFEVSNMQANQETVTKQPRIQANKTEDFPWTTSCHLAEHWILNLKEALGEYENITRHKSAKRERVSREILALLNSYDPAKKNQSEVAFSVFKYLIDEEHNIKKYGFFGLGILGKKSLLHAILEKAKETYNPATFQQYAQELNGIERDQQEQERSGGMKTILSEVEVENAELKKGFKQTKQALEAAQTNYEVVNKQLIVDQTKKVGLAKEKGLLSEQLESSQTQLKATQTALTAKTQECAAAVKERDALRQNESERLQGLQEKVKTLESEKKSLQDKKAVLQEQKQAALEENQKLKKDKSDLESLVSEKQWALDNSTSLNEKQCETIKKLEADNQTFRSQLEEQRQVLQKKEKEIKELQIQKSDFREQLNAQEQINQDMKQEIKKAVEVKDLYQQHVKKNGELAKENDELIKKYQEQVQVTEEVNAVKEEQAAKIEVLEAEKQTVKQMRSGLEAQQKELNEKVRALDTTVIALNKFFIATFPALRKPNAEAKDIKGEHGFQVATINDGLAEIIIAFVKNKLTELLNGKAKEESNSNSPSTLASIVGVFHKSGKKAKAKSQELPKTAPGTSPSPSPSLSQTGDGDK